MKSENLGFPTFESFVSWEQNLEHDTRSRYVVSRSKAKFKTKTHHYFSCHRSGHFVSESKNLRNLKSQGSNKISGFCPAGIKLVQDNNTGQCEVHYIQTHVGHTNDLGHLPLSTEERDVLVMKIAAKIPLDTILDELRENICNSLERVQLVTRKDLHNIEAAFSLTSGEKRHKDDGTSVHSWVTEMESQDFSCIVYYKQQGVQCSDEEFPFIKDDDFILIVMNEGQREMLQKYANNIICIDGTHGLNNYDFELITLLVVDDLHQGFPCAFMFTNRTDEQLMTLFFEKIKRKVGNIMPNVFMSDMAESFYNGWHKVMGEPKKRLFCTWHVIKAWRKNLSEKISNSEKRQEVYKEVTTLLQETDVNAENICAKNYRYS